MGKLWNWMAATAMCTVLLAAGQAGASWFIIDGPPEAITLPNPFPDADDLPDFLVNDDPIHYGLVASLNDLRLTNPTNSVPLPPVGSIPVGCNSFFDIFGDVSVRQDPYPPNHYLIAEWDEVSWQVTPPSQASNVMTYATEITQMNLTIQGSNNQMMIRESPTLHSTGEVRLEDLSGSGGTGLGPYMISSFFDVFTELSIDGGQTWIPADDSVRIEMTPEPSSLLLLALGGLALLRRR